MLCCAVLSETNLRDTIESGADIPAEQYRGVRYLALLLAFVCKALAGSEPISARLSLLLASYAKGLRVVDTVLPAVLLEERKISALDSAALVGDAYMRDVVDRKDRLTQRRAKAKQAEAQAMGMTVAERKAADDADDWSKPNVEQAVEMITKRVTTHALHSQRRKGGAQHRTCGELSACIALSFCLHVPLVVLCSCRSMSI
jgi:hypothetical protein